MTSWRESNVLLWQSSPNESYVEQKALPNILFVGKSLFLKNKNRFKNYQGNPFGTTKIFEPLHDNPDKRVLLSVDGQHLYKKKRGPVVEARDLQTWMSVGGKNKLVTI